MGTSLNIAESLIPFCVETSKTAATLIEAG